MSLLTMDELCCNKTKHSANMELYQEVARDSMLEKIVLISVAYFCIATEMRFMAKQKTTTLSDEGGPRNAKL